MAQGVAQAIVSCVKTSAGARRRKHGARFRASDLLVNSRSKDFPEPAIYIYIYIYIYLFIYIVVQLRRASYCAAGVSFRASRLGACRSF